MVKYVTDVYMRISLCINDAIDLIPIKETFLDRTDSFLFNDPKRKMFETHSLDVIFPSLKKSGLEGLEFLAPSHLSRHNVETIKEILHRYDLKIFSIHQSRGTYLTIDFAEIERLCGIAQNFDSHVVVIHVNALGKKLSDASFIKQLKVLQKKYHITFGIENVSKSPFSWEKKMYKGRGFGQTINLLDLAITFDTTHLGQSGDDICEFYKKNKDKIVNIHLSNYRENWLNRALFLTNGTHLPLEQGKLPIKEFLATLKKENYQGLITMEINGDLNTLCQNASMIRDAFK